MKIRSDFVSNSSSSSFILSDMDVFKHFNITKQDIMDALVDAYGKERFEQYISDRKKRSLDPEWSKWYSKNRKWNQWGPIYVFDLHDESDNAAAREMFGSLLKDWDANNCHVISDDELHMGELQDVLRPFERNDQDAVIITNARHYQALTRARDAIARAIDGLTNGLSGDLLDQDIRECLHWLGEITGEITTDNILGEVFAHFCIGK